MLFEKREKHSDAFDITEKSDIRRGKGKSNFSFSLAKRNLRNEATNSDFSITDILSECGLSENFALSAKFWAFTCEFCG